MTRKRGQYRRVGDPPTDKVVFEKNLSLHGFLPRISRLLAASLVGDPPTLLSATSAKDDLTFVWEGDIVAWACALFSGNSARFTPLMGESVTSNASLLGDVKRMLCAACLADLA